MIEQNHFQSEDFVPDGSICSDTYILAHAAGELHGVAVRRYLEDFKQAEGKIDDHIHLILGRLHRVHALSKSELLHLKAIVKLLNNQQASSADALKVVRDVHNTLVDEESSPCALALASIAKNSIHLAIEMESMKRKVNWWHVLGADLKGAGAGALGGAAAGGVGATLGAVCGAAIGSGAALEMESK